MKTLLWRIVLYIPLLLTMACVITYSFLVSRKIQMDNDNEKVMHMMCNFAKWTAIKSGIE